MNNKEFEDFFKNLEPDTEPKKTPSEDEDLVFSSFFEDATSSAKKEPEPVKTKNEVFEFEDDIFAPPPPEEEEQVFVKEPVKKAEEPVPEKKKAPQKTQDDDYARKKKKKRLNTAYNWLLTVIWVSGVLATSVLSLRLLFQVSMTLSDSARKAGKLKLLFRKDTDFPKLQIFLKKEELSTNLSPLKFMQG